MKRKKNKKKWSTLPWRLLKRYLENCSIHGLKYLVKEDCHWSERLFWFIICFLSWWGCINMVIGVLTEYTTRPVATTVETNYLGWETYFPALHFCATVDPKKRGATTWPTATKAHLQRIMDINRWGYCDRLAEPHDSESFENFAKSVTMECAEVFDYCILSGKRMNCCDIIFPLWTPVGHCLVFNSIHTTPSEGERKRLSVPDGSALAIHFLNSSYFKMVKSSMNIYVIDRLDLPSILTTGERKVGAKWATSVTQIDVTQEPTYNEIEVRDVKVDRRHCRFRNEAEELKIYKWYSYDACLAEDIVSRMLKYCGCVSHVVPHNDEMPTCDFAGLSCLFGNHTQLINTHFIPCSADCEEITFEFFSNFLETSVEIPSINVYLLFGPTIRYRRYMVHSELDVVVAVGSAVGLFVGASILSLVEIPYWFIVRSLDDEDEEDNSRRQ